VIQVNGKEKATGTRKKHIVSHWNRRDAEETATRVVVMPLDKEQGTRRGKGGDYGVSVVVFQYDLEGVPMRLVDGIIGFLNNLWVWSRVPVWV
jgi:hypothetical protein